LQKSHDEGSFVSANGAKISMKTKTIDVTILGFIAAAAVASARIGDDEKQIEARYGKAAKEIGEKAGVRQVGYASGAFAVVVDFVNGISRREGFAKPDTSMLTSEEIQQILNVSAADNTTWKEAPGKQGDRIWNRSDNKAIAILPGRGTFLMVKDVNFTQPKE